MPDAHLGRTVGVGSQVVWPGGASLQGPHRIGSFCLCPQLEAFSHELELRGVVEKEALVIGTLVHVGLAYRYASMLPVRPEWYVYNDGREAIWICGHENPDLRIEALRIFDAYQAHYAVNTITPVLVEHQFVVELDLGDGRKEPYSCRTDLLGVENGEYVIFDHKCFRSISRYTGYEYRADRQMLTNLWLARAHGYDVKRVVLNTMTKDAQPRFMRYDIPVSHKAFADLWTDTHYWLTRMNETRKQFPDPMNRPKVLESCTRKYGRCEYQTLCHEGLHTIVEYKKRTDK
ncbi:MAG TPA: hypothetical protein VGY48_15515 [Vicinamibacterales bacterium]|jgi:hypothetical protein|nr:hypothetical protein [Vicinamibacterales bacterium]